MNLRLAIFGVLLILLAALTFPRQGHPLRHVLERITAPSKQQAVNTLKEVLVVNEAALDFEPTPQLFHAGWSRLDLVLEATENPSSWIGGLPEMPTDIDWPETDGKAALFLAQIAMSDLPENIWGGIGPKSGWLLFFLAPQDWGGARVVHIEERGAPRPYPNGACIENYLQQSDRDAMTEIGRTAEDFRPPQIALAASPTDAQPWGLFTRITELDALRKPYYSTDVSDPLFEPFASGPNPTHLSIEMLARQAYLQDPNGIPTEMRDILEPMWKFAASLEPATMSGPVETEFFYTAPDNPVRLLRLPSSLLLGWQFGDVQSLGIFIAPEDLRAGKWDKVWFDYTG